MNRLSYFLLTFAWAGIVFDSAPARGQVPGILNYQGRVAVDGINFNGTGRFKFALVNGTGTAIFWNNDGSSFPGGQPFESIAIGVTNGVYSVLLGDTTLPGMTSIPASVFGNADVRLRVWFDDGVHGFQLLVPDQRIAAVGYAIKAGLASTVSDGAITAQKIANGAVIASLNAQGQSGVPSGAFILSPTESPALVSAGYVKSGSFSLTGFTTYIWQAAPAPANGAPPSPRDQHTAVWTGSEMIIWGGSSNGLASGAVNTGAKYNPTTNGWTPVTANGAPAARILHTAVWTGSEMVIWGGDTSNGAQNGGGRYNPVTDTWTAINTASAPTARHEHTAVWAGDRMIVWGGATGTSNFNDGGQYDPVTDTWTPVTTIGAPIGRDLHTAVWTGSEMIVWGGAGISGTENDLLGDGARYNPFANTWTAISTAGAPPARHRHTAVWTGTSVVVWGGEGDGFRNDGARYNPVTDTWQGMTTNSAPAGRFKHSALWNGSEMIVWGGYGGADLSSGGRYNPSSNTWLANLPGTAPSPRESHTAVWTGTQMIIWGGHQSAELDSYLNDTWFLAPGAQNVPMFLYQKQ